MLKPLNAAIFIACVSLIAACSPNADKTVAPITNGLIKKESNFSFDQTVTKLEAALTARNITLMSKIDHAANAGSVEKSLHPTTLFIFGNPAIGTELMNLSQSMGLDLPMKALVFEDLNGDVWVEYHNMKVLAERHGIPAENEIIARVVSALDAITTDATMADE